MINRKPELILAIIGIVLSLLLSLIFISVGSEKKGKLDEGQTFESLKATEKALEKEGKAIDKEKATLDKENDRLEKEATDWNATIDEYHQKLEALNAERDTVDAYSEAAVNAFNAKVDEYNGQVEALAPKLAANIAAQKMLESDYDDLKARASEYDAAVTQQDKDQSNIVIAALQIVGIIILAGCIMAIVGLILTVKAKTGKSIVGGILLIVSSVLSLNPLILIAGIMALVKSPKIVETE